MKVEEQAVTGRAEEFGIGGTPEVLDDANVEAAAVDGLPDFGGKAGKAVDERRDGAAGTHRGSGLPARRGFWSLTADR